MTVIANKPIELNQLELEMKTANVIRLTQHLGMSDNIIYSYDQDGTPINFADENAAQAVVDNHVALRDKNDKEYALEYRTGVSSSRETEILAMVTGMLNREKVPLTDLPPVRTLPTIFSFGTTTERETDT